MFIRTKDRIYETRENGETYNGFGCKFNNGTIKIHKKDILKQSNNLAELCDEFVIDDKRNNVHYLMNYDDVIDEINNGRIYDEDVIYGAIWTDKGLIYVAKMNKKGELELICW